MLILILAESALERVPREIWGHPSVANSAKKRGKEPGSILLDRSIHHPAMKELPMAEKRGRPDIVHFSLLEALGTPLNREGLLKIYVHTINNYIINVNPKIRLPKNYNRFVGLIEQLYERGRVPPRGEALLELRKGSIKKLISEVKPEYIIAFTTLGKPCTISEAIKKLSTYDRPASIIGGFPHGHFTKETMELANEKLSIDPEPLEAWTVISRLIYAYEEAISIQKKRLKQYKKKKA